ncbi:hypothetical protein PRIPAC_96709 [Pristionchus pacificus]|uniref:Uncharacterized protein n=1 Tax=Pristionchus pacificus TaxID=54126 RepID=A0A2A6D2J8_PRIPA|nr:hypothetical protein PRIPAC_96709 [Pristionchus pacificus]|eukprot:PDM84511.1 hypothetical protein PRIPAC_33534 [Pristionchus pacificus]
MDEAVLEGEVGAAMLRNVVDGIVDVGAVLVDVVVVIALIEDDGHVKDGTESKNIGEEIRHTFTWTPPEELEDLPRHTRILLVGLLQRQEAPISDIDVSDVIAHRCAEYPGKEDTVADRLTAMASRRSLSNNVVQHCWFDARQPYSKGKTNRKYSIEKRRTAR